MLLATTACTGPFFLPLFPCTLSHRTFMYTPAGGQRCTPTSTSLSPLERGLHTISISEYSQSLHGSPGDAHIDRLGSTSLHLVEPFDPYYCQHKGHGVNMGSHFPNNPILYHVPLYPTSSDPAYTWQGNGIGSMNGYWTLPIISPQNHPSWLGGPFMDKATESLHTSIAQVMADVKGLATHVTSQSEKEGEQSEKMDQILT